MVLVRYEFQVARDPQFADLIVNEDFLVEPKTERNMPVATNLWWRVRAVVTDDNKGEWAEQAFTTDLPKAELISPGNYPASSGCPYPWGIELKWTAVKGAASYRVEVTRIPNPIPVPESFDPTKHEAFDIEVTAPQTSTTINLPCTWLGDLEYEWQVRVRGPDPWNEEGELSESFKFSPDGDDTFAKHVQPWANFVGPLSCQPYGEVPLSWQPVKLAKAYRVVVWEVHGLPGGNLSPGAVLVDKIVPAVPVGFQTAQLPGSGGPFFHINAAGCIWDVQALGPDGLRGMWRGDGGGISHYYLVHPTVPQPLSTYAQFTEGETVTIGWSTGLAHGGLFLLHLYDGSHCADADLILSKQIQGWASGETIGDLIGLVAGKTYSWKVHPMVYVGCPDSELWSPCAEVKIVKKYVSPTPTGECDQLIAWGTTHEQHHVIDLHKTSGAFSLWYNAYTIPDRFIVMYEGNVLFDQCLGADATGIAEGTVALSLPGGGTSTVVEVTVKPNCQYFGDTEWEFMIFCQ
jgi:hypothetical protein